MASGVIVRSDDGKTNLVQETWQAFISEGVNEVVDADVEFVELENPDLLLMDVAEGGPRARPMRGANEPREKALSAAQVRTMLNDPNPWKLLIRTGDGSEVLDKTYLAAAWKNSSGRSAITVYTRFPQAAEERALDPEGNPGSLKKLADVRGIPASGIASITAIAGVYALAEKASNPKFVTLAGGLAAAAFIVAAWAASRVTVKKVRWSRLDEIERKHNERVQLGAARVKIPALLTVAAGAAYLIAMTTSGGEAAASATIAKPSAVAADTGMEAVIAVNWSDLSASVDHVDTTVTGGKGSVDGTQARADDGSSSQELTVPLNGPGEITVTTRAIGKNDKPVGKGFIQTFTVKGP